MARHYTKGKRLAWLMSRSQADSIARRTGRGTEGPSRVSRGRGYCSHCSRKQTELQYSTRLSQAGAVAEEEAVRHNQELDRRRKAGKGTVVGVAVGPGSHSHMDSATCWRT